jgi:hypothetical protein
MGLVHGSMSSDFEPQRAVPPNEDSEQQRAGPSSHDPGVPVRVGGPRIATQLSTFLPGAHLTLISVLQGVGLAVLAGEVNSAHLELLPNALLYVDSVLLIFLAWFLYVAAFVGSQWPFNALHSALQFGFAAAEVYAFSHVTHPRQWLFGFAAAAIIGGIIRLLNIILLEERMYTVDAHNFYRQDRSDERTGGVTFVTLGVVFTVVAVIWRSHLVMDIAGGIILVLLVLMLVGYDRLWNVTINQLLKGTTWSLSRWGILVEDTATNVRASNLTRRPRVARMMAGGLKNDDAGEDETQRGSETGVLQ